MCVHYSICVIYLLIVLKKTLQSIARSLPTAHHILLPMPNTLRQPMQSLLPKGTPLIAVGVDDIQRVFEDVLGALDGVVVVHEKMTTAPVNEERVSTQDEAMDVSKGGELDRENVELVVHASRDTWSRKARRQRQNLAGASISSSNSIPQTFSPPTNVPPPQIDALTVEIRAIPAYTTENFCGPKSKSKSKGNGNGNEMNVNEADKTKTQAQVQAWTLECTWCRGHERALFEGFWSHVCRKMGPALLNLKASGK